MPEMTCCGSGHVNMAQATMVITRGRASGIILFKRICIPDNGDHLAQSKSRKSALDRRCELYDHSSPATQAIGYGHMAEKIIKQIYGQKASVFRKYREMCVGDQSFVLFMYF